MTRVIIALALLVLLSGLRAEVLANQQIESRKGLDNAEVIGDTVVIGTTWYDHNRAGSIGRMVARSGDGYVHFSWSDGSNCYYNFINPAGMQGWPGMGTSLYLPGGTPTLDVMADGRAVIAYNRIGARNNTAVAVDFFPHTGTFLIFEPAYFEDLEILWPHLYLDRQGLIRIVSTENADLPCVPQRHFYTEGAFDSTGFYVSFPPLPDTWTEMSYTMTIAGDLAASPVTDRVAFAWTYCREEGFPNPDSTYTILNNDIWMLIDDDGQDLRFDDAFNLTQFIPPDLAYLPDTTIANMDTFRTYMDLSLLINADDWVHITFTTISFYEIQRMTYGTPSIVWHWSEQFPGEFQTIHNGYADWPGQFISCGAWTVVAQRPSLSRDPATGYLYCAYQVYDIDSTAFSAAGYPSAEIFVSVSPDGGLNWSMGTNVSETVTPGNAAPGQCLSEVCPSMARLVDDTCHIIYILDRDAGSVIQGEGTWTLNDIIYHKVPASEIDTSQWVPQYPYDPGGIPFHVLSVPVAPSTPERPSQFVMCDPYPNPFNPTATLSYTLPQALRVKMTVYDLVGREIAVLADGWRRAGRHQVVFDGTDRPSGLYIYKFQAGDFRAWGKMVLIK